MKKMSEAEKLAGYEKALDNLSPEVQLEKILAVKSPETLRRFLSEDAPDRLVRRFVHRVNEVMAVNFNDFENGRIAYQRGSYDTAKIFLGEADQSGHKDAPFYLAKIYFEMGFMSEAEDYLKSSLEKNNDPERLAQIYHLKAIIADRQRRLNQAGKYYQKAIDMGTPDKSYFAGRKKCIAGDCEGAIRDFESGAHNAGGELSARALMKCKMEKHPDDVSGYDELKRIYLLQVQRGDTFRYLDLAGIAEKAGKMDDAAAFYVKALLLGVTGGPEHLLKFVMDSGSGEQVFGMCRKYFGRYPDKVFKAMFTVLFYAHDYMGVFDLLNEMVLKGQRGLVDEAILFATEVDGMVFYKAFVRALDAGKKYDRVLVAMMYSKIYLYFGKVLDDGGIGPDEAESKYN